MSLRLRPMNSSESDDSHTHALGTHLAAKPLPRLPRGWSRVCHETGLFLRSIGLGILVTTFQGYFTNNFLEPEKAAIRQSRVTAFLRALIHIPPLGLSIFEIILNCKGRYVGAISNFGADYNNQNYLQFVAKAHEIYIQASLGAIVLSYIRYQICTGRGIPFGAMLGGLQFFQFSYLWSVEFWSAIFSKDFHLRKKICFAVLILVCVVITATAGPSSANLLIAQQGVWRDKSSYVVMNATFSDIWPIRVDDKGVSANCKTFSPFSDNGCPLPILYQLLTDLPIKSLMHRYDITVNGLVKGFWLGSRFWQTAQCFDGYDQVCSTFPMGKFTKILTPFATPSLVSHRAMKKEYYQLYTAGLCVTDTVQNSSDQAALRFPRLWDTASEITGGQKTFLVPDLMKGQSTYNIPGNTSQFRVGWVDLPYEVFGTGIPGAIILHPQSSKNSPYNITTCTLNAGWGSSSITYDIDKNEVVSGMTNIPSSWHIPYRHIGVPKYPKALTPSPIFQNTSQFSYPQLRINISKSWMEFLNPSIVLSDSLTTSPISIMMTKIQGPPEAYQVASLLNLLLVAALSDIGGLIALGIYDDPSILRDEYEVYSQYEIEVSTSGWEYTAQHTTTKLAIAVMLAYCALVLGHFIYSVIFGVSSTAWDSVAEMIVLAMNSSPTETLQNTCAGIIGRKPFQANVRVLKSSEKHLELVFGEITDPNANFSHLTMNEKYGSIANVREEEDELLDMGAQGEILGGDMV